MTVCNLQYRNYFILEWYMNIFNMTFVTDVALSKLYNIAGGHDAFPEVEVYESLIMMII